MNWLSSIVKEYKNEMGSFQKELKSEISDAKQNGISEENPTNQAYSEITQADPNTDINSPTNSPDKLTATKSDNKDFNKAFDLMRFLTINKAELLNLLNVKLGYNFTDDYISANFCNINESFIKNQNSNGPIMYNGAMVNYEQFEFRIRNNSEFFESLNKAMPNLPKILANIYNETEETPAMKKQMIMYLCNMAGSLTKTLKSRNSADDMILANDLIQVSVVDDDQLSPEKLKENQDVFEDIYSPNKPNNKKLEYEVIDYTESNYNKSEEKQLPDFNVITIDKHAEKDQNSDKGENRLHQEPIVRKSSGFSDDDLAI